MLFVKLNCHKMAVLPVIKWYLPLTIANWKSWSDLLRNSTCFVSVMCALKAKIRASKISTFQDKHVMSTWQLVHYRAVFQPQWTRTTFPRLKQNQICPCPSHRKSRPKLDHTWPWQPRVFYFLLRLAFSLSTPNNVVYWAMVDCDLGEWIDYLFTVSYRTGHFWPWQRWPTIEFI